MTFSDQFIEILNAITSKIGIAVDWTSNNVMTYVQDLIPRLMRYEIATSIAWIVFMILLTTASFLILKSSKRKTREGKYEDDAAVFFSSLMFCIFLTVTVFVVVNQTMDIIAAYTLPEQVILDKFIKIKESLGN